MQVSRKLPLVASISLILAFCAPCFSAKAADVSLYAIYKRQVYVQTSEAEPAPSCCGYIFNAVVELTESNSVIDASLSAPNGSHTPLSLSYEQEFLPHRWILSVSTGFPSTEALETTWGKGNYTLSIFGAKDGLITIPLDLSGDAYPAHAPHIRNFAETQAVDASKDFVLHWTPFKEGTTNDCCFVLVTRTRDGVALSNTPLLEDPNHLNGISKSILIPAGTLAAGEQYDVYVRFDKVVARDAKSYPGVVGRATYAKGTHLTLKTLPGARSE
jgi:hypothetical protein